MRKSTYQFVVSAVGNGVAASVVASLALYLAACGSAGPQQDSGNLQGSPRGSEGDSCSGGALGTPDAPCAEGLVCVYPEGSSAPSGPDGSSSASTGTCEPAGGSEGDSCSDGALGTPDAPCAEGLVCVYPDGSSEPEGPDGSSSASTGTCEQAGGSEGDSCSDGALGTPVAPCAVGLFCVYPDGSSDPEGPDGSSSGDTGTCEP